MVESKSVLGRVGDFDVGTLSGYPLIKHAVSGRPLELEEACSVSDASAACLDEMRRSMGGLMSIGRRALSRVDPTLSIFDYLPISKDQLDLYGDSNRRLCWAPTEFLEMGLLPYATDPDHVRCLVWGYVLHCVKDNMGDIMARITGSSSITHQSLLYVVGSMSSCGLWQSLHSCGRNGLALMGFVDALRPDQLEPYVNETSRDGAFMLMVDPTMVPPMATNSEFGMFPNVERKIPDAKRMTPPKIARLLQLPGLREHIDNDRFKFVRTVGTDLAIIAEYFCENDDVVNMNAVTVEDVRTWLVSKFKKHNPSLNVARYQLLRLHGTSFERAGDFIQQYILDLHEKEHPWLFEVAGISKADCVGYNPLFVLYSRVACNIESVPESRVVELGSVLPGHDWINVFCDGDESPLNLLSHIGEVSSRVSEVSVSQIRCDVNDVHEFNRSVLGFLSSYGLNVCDRWVEHPGFELLDPMEISRYANENSVNAFDEILKGIVTRVSEMSPRELLCFKHEVVDRLPEHKRADAQALITELAERMALSISFDDLEPEILIQVARGQSVLPAGSILLPGDVRYEELVGKVAIADRIGPLAERALLQRHLSGVRGEQDIVSYLMSHRDSIHPAELVLPYPDAPNREVIREFGDSPDLLALLQMTTLLVYLGYTPDQIMAEISAQAQLSVAGSHSSLTTVGLEWEQVGASSEGLIVDPKVFPWLFNVLPAGNDKSSNELMTSPTLGVAMQGLMMSLVTDPRFGFMRMDRLFGQAGASPRSSLHLNMAVPRDLPFEHGVVGRFMSPLNLASWFIHGSGDDAISGFTSNNAGVVRGWRGRSLLDVLGDKRPDAKVELKKLAIEPDASHLRDMAQFQMLGSAGMQRMREEARLPLSPSEKIMAGLYESFSREIRSVGRGGVEVSREVVGRYASQVATELGVTCGVQKTSGIVLTDHRGVVVPK